MKILMQMPQGEENDSLTENMAGNSLKKHKRGDQVSVNGCIGNFLKYTPKGLGGNIILRGDNTRPMKIPLNEIGQVNKLAFEGEYFMIAGESVTGYMDGDPPCINYACSVHQGGGGVQCIRGCSVHQGDTMSTLGIS